MGLLSSIGSALGGIFGGPAGAAIAGGALSLIGGERRNRAQTKATAATNAMSAAEAQKNRDWEERLSNTAHQRQMTDMRAAGLNPILSAKYGGASTPSGSMASFQTPQFQDTLTPAVNTGMEVFRTQQIGKQTTANIQKIDQEISNLKMKWHLDNNQVDLVRMQLHEVNQRIENMQTQRQGQLQNNDIRQVVSDFFKALNTGGDTESLTGTMGRALLDGINAIWNLGEDYVKWYYETMFNNWRN